MPLMSSHAQITDAPITAAVRPLRPIQAAEPAHRILGPLRSNRVADQRHLEKPLLHHTEEHDERHRGNRSRVMSMDVVERGDVGDTREVQRRADDEGEPRVALAE